MRNTEHVFRILFYGLLMLLLKKTTIPYLIIFSYVLLLVPFLTLYSKTNMGGIFKYDSKKGLLNYRYEQKGMGTILSYIVIKILCLGWILGLTWYTFTVKFTMTELVGK